MKYWRGYLVAAILAAISGALIYFAKAHPVLVDMIYPYVTRLIISSLADWTGALSFCLWQVLLIGLVALGVASIVLMIVLRWNFVQWLGWVLAVVSCLSMCHTALYGLNKYASPLADDARLEIIDFTVSELNEATIYFRDKANAMAQELPRNEKGDPDFGSFEDLAQQAGEGFRVLTYDQAISVFAGSTAPVKKLSWSGIYTLRRQSGVTVPLTGEAAVNPDLPSALLPFAMCKEMAHRISIYDDADACYAAFLACTANSSPAFQYSAYLMAYKFCYDAIVSIPTSTAQACATQTDKGVNAQFRSDLEDYTRFYGKTTGTATVRTQAPTLANPTATGEEEVVVTFSSYAGVADMLASWYVGTFIIPLNEEEELPFNPLDPTQVDLSDAAAPAA